MKTMPIPRTIPDAHNPFTIQIPRAGFDRVLFSFPMVYAAPNSLPKLSLPRSPGVFQRQTDRALPSHPTYRRRAAYVTPDGTTFMDVFYRPRCTPRPLFQVQFRASMRRLLDLGVVEEAIGQLLDHRDRLLHLDGASDEIGRRLFPFRLTPSEVEFTIDFPAGETRELRRSLHTPWCRQNYGSDPDGAPSKGSRRPRNGFRAYAKKEEGIEVSRVEWIIRRDQLRRWRVNTVADLRHVPWSELVPKRMRFVKYQPSRKHHRVPDWAYEGELRVRGANGMLRKHSRKARQRLRGRLCPDGYQGQAEEALRAFEEGLLKDLRLRR